MILLKYLLLLISLVSYSNALSDEPISSWAINGITGWDAKIFSGETRYQATSYKEQPALHAISQQSASGLVLEKRIDLLETPVLNWSWLIKKALPPLDERSKEGDDYVARVYVVIDGGLLFWNTLSLSYVWSSSQHSGQVWDNAYAGSNVKMVAIRGSDADTEQWFHEKRNVYNDLIQFFGDRGSDENNLESYRYIDAIAIMTDTDNSQTQAEAFYGDLYFSAN